MVLPMDPPFHMKGTIGIQICDISKHNYRFSLYTEFIETTIWKQLNRICQRLERIINPLKSNQTSFIFRYEDHKMPLGILHYNTSQTHPWLISRDLCWKISLNVTHPSTTYLMYSQLTRIHVKTAPWPDMDNSLANYVKR